MATKRKDPKRVKAGKKAAKTMKKRYGDNMRRG